MSTFPIDIVIPWVDGSDPLWQEEHRKYKADSLSDNSSARYREWGLFKYWFRGIDIYAPWVNKIHLITYGHLPKWLDINHQKLHIVNHKDYIPEEYLPTFSSHAIELNIHKIPGLSDYFLYFNDDVYLTSPTKSEDFFINGKPVDTAVFGIIKNDDSSNYMPYIMLNMLAEINMNFSKREMLKNFPSKWLTPRNGKGLLYNLYLLPWGVYTGFRNYHSCTSFCKSTFVDVWEKCNDILVKTCANKFRSKEDVNQYLMRYWQLCEGNFVPQRPISAYITIGKKNTKDIENLMYNKKYKIVCINDDPMDFDYEEERKGLIVILERKFPNPSSFEI